MTLGLPALQRCMNNRAIMILCAVAAHGPRMFGQGSILDSRWWCVKVTAR
jgi:hypothetical protein